MKRRAFIGDIHGCIDEFKELYRLLKADGVDEVWHCGDLVDRGPDSGAVIQFCIDNKIPGVMGNHDAVIVNHWKIKQAGGTMRTKNPDKIKTLSQMTQAYIDYMDALPYYFVFDDIKAVVVHGGMYPGRAFYNQPEQALCRLQLINLNYIGQTRWFNKDRKGITEETYRAQGWERWYRLWDMDYDVVFGHSGFISPLIHENQMGGRCIGVDTRCCFGGTLTAVILPEMKFVSVQSVSGMPDMIDFVPEEGGHE